MQSVMQTTSVMVKEVQVENDQSSAFNCLLISFCPTEKMFCPFHLLICMHENFLSTDMCTQTPSYIYVHTHTHTVHIQSAEPHVQLVHWFGCSIWYGCMSKKFCFWFSVLAFSRHSGSTKKFFFSSWKLHFHSYFQP